MELNPAFSLLATLLIAPIAWTSLQWATYSSQQNGEIKSAGSFRDQSMIIIGSLIVTGLLLALLAFVLERAVGTQFLYVAGSGYWSGVGEATLAGSYLWPNILATAIADNRRREDNLGRGLMMRRPLDRARRQPGSRHAPTRTDR